MKQETSGLAASYGRRAWHARLGSAAFAAGLAITLAPALAQDEGAQIAQNKKDPASAKQTGKTGANKKSDGKATGKPTAKDAKSKQAGKNTGRAADKTPASDNKGMRIVPMPGQGANTPGRGVPGVPTGSVPQGVPPGGVPPQPNLLGGQGGAFGGGQGETGGTPFTFDFRGSDIDNVLKFFSNMSGLTITKDPALTGPVTILNPKAVTLDQAFRILQSVLYVRGFTAVQSNGVLQILPFKGAVTSTQLLNPGVNEDGITRVDPRNQFMTQVIPVENVDAETLARELKDLISPSASLIGSSGTNSLIITDTASNVSRFIALVDAVDKTSNKTDLKIYALTRSDATAIAQIINDVFSKSTTRGRSAPQNPQQPQQPGQQQGASRPAVVAVADTATNSVIVVASPDNQVRIANEIISRLDGDDTNRLETVTRKINFADAQTVADLVNSVLSNARPGQGSSTNPSFQQRTFGGFGGFFGGGGGNSPTGSSDPFGKVVPDPRTNTLLITATKDRMVRINDLIDKLDQEVPVEPTTFVFPLKNANSSDISQALGQAFGTASNNNNNGFNPFGFFGGGNSSSQTRNPFGRQQSTGRAQSGTTIGGRSARNRNIPPGPPNAPDQGGNGFSDPSIQDNGGSAQPNGIPGIMTDQGFIPTEAPGDAANNATMDPRTRQIFFGGGFGRQRLGQTSSPQYGPGRTGGYSNLLQLQGNVFVTPSPDGDSLIVTTVPQNYEAVRQIIESLDIVPRQVMIEVIIAEVTLSSDQKLGYSLGGNFLKLLRQSNTAQGAVNLPAAGSGTAFDPTGTGAQFLLNGADYTTLLQALTTDNKVRVLATPRVFASNNQPADLQIATQIPFIQGVQSNGFSNVTTNNIQTAPIGFLLTVTPRITRQGLVTISVTQEANDLVRFETLGSGVNASTYPVINTRNTDTIVTAQDGETIVIGGLIRDNRATNITKIPILGDIPLIGQFFRSREITRDKTELMIFMTPHVVNTVEEARKLAIQQSASIVRQNPDLSAQQPNLKLPVPPKGTKIDPKTLPHDASGHPYYPGPGANDTNSTDKGAGKGAGGTNNGTGTGGGTSNPTDKPPVGAPH